MGQGYPTVYDVGVVGAGIVGLMCAYHLAKMGLRVVVFERSQGPGEGVTANQSEVLHVVQLPFGSLKSRLAREGNPMYDELCRELGVPLRRLPALLVVTGRRGLPALFLGYLYLWFNLRSKFRVRLVGRRELRRIEPSLSKRVLAAIVVEGYGVVDTKTLVRRLCVRLQEMGVVFRFGCEVVSASRSGDLFVVSTGCGQEACRAIVNAAGLYADEVSRRLGLECGQIAPSLGVMVEFSGRQLGAIVAPFSLRQRGRTKGGGIIPTVRGTYIFGPTFRLIGSKGGDQISEEDVAELLQKFSPLIEHSASHVRTYAGVRPLSPTGDFVVAEDPTGRIVSLVGIESPGLTAAPALGLLVATRLRRRLGGQ